MIANLKSDFRKILTVRSTYILVLIALVLTTLFTYFGTSAITYQEQVSGKTIDQRLPDGNVKTIPDPNDPPVFVNKTEHKLPKEKLIANLQDATPPITLFLTVVVVLFMAHEYRYNTIAYTLTTSRRRYKVLLSKLIVSTTFITVAALLALGVTAVVTFAAIGVKGLELPVQDFNWVYVIGRLMSYSLGFSLMGLAIITLVRNLTAGVAAIFILPTLDAIIGGLLSTRHIEATRALPFSALDRISSILRDYAPSGTPGNTVTASQHLPASVLGASFVFLTYLIGVWAIAWVLFLKRDSN
jgi:ABC-type transport system involved in multi-copper enzyme maturation permease subunit